MLRICVLLGSLLLIGCKDDAPTATSSAPETTASEQIAAEPTDAAGYYRRAIFYEETGDYQRADEDFIHAYQLDSTDSNYAFSMASIWVDREQYADAARLLERLDTENRPRERLLLAEVQLGQQAYEEALESVDPLTDMDIPQQADAYYLIGEVRVAQGDTAAALAAYRQIDLIDRQYLAGNYRAGELLLELGLPAEAYREFNVIVNNDPANVSARYLRGRASELLGQNAEAIRDYEAVLRMEPTFSEAREALDRVSQ